MADKDWQAEIDLLQQRDRKSRMILGVSENAGDEEVRRAFRRQSVANHPDKNPGDADAPRRFNLIHCAYKFLATGQSCPALDEFQAPPPDPAKGKYNMENPWGYWCWWRENFFDKPEQE